MNINLEKLEKSQRKVNVVTTKETWKKHQDEAFKELAKNVEVPGFRKGHAPENIAKTKISQVDLLQKAADKVIDEAYKKAIKEYNLYPVYQPELNIKKFSDEEFEFEIMFVEGPKAEVIAYKGFKVPSEHVEVTDEEVNKKIDKLLNKNAELELVENGILEKGNTAVIDFDGFVDGVAFEGGSAKNFSLEIGSNTFVPGFEDQLIGMKVDEESDIKVTFPTNYVKDLAGKEATFKVKLHEIKRKVIPTLDLDFIKEANIEGVNTVEELNKHFYDEVLSDKQAKTSEKQTKELIEVICEKATFEVADKVLDEEVEYMVNNFKARLQQSGLTYEDYLKQTGVTEEKVKEDARAESYKNLKQMVVLHEIGKKENITVDQAEVDAKLQEMATMYQMTVEDIKKALGDRLNQIATDLRNNKIITFLKENNDLA